nr:hypothetical protein MACL_00001629 [Theileria orientalis]
MTCKKTDKKRRLSPRLAAKRMPKYDLSNNTLCCNTSESSLSTCDSLQLNTNLPKSNDRFSEKLPNSFKNDYYLNSDNESDDKSVSNDEKICKRCDQLTCQLTEMRIQNFDRWLSEIKTLEDMLYKKELIIEDFKKTVFDKENEITKLKKDELTLKRNNTKLHNQIMALKEQISSKDSEIYELESTLKEKNDVITNRNKTIEKLEKLAQEDSKLIKRLRSNASN